MNQPSVVVPCYNAEKNIRPVVERLLATTPAGTRVIVVNDGSTDGTADILRGIDGIQVLSQPRKGVASALNVGLDAVGEGDAIIFHADIFVQNEDWLECLRAAAYGGNAPAVTGARLLFPSGRTHSLGRTLLHAWGNREHRANRSWLLPDTGDAGVLQADAVAGQLVYIPWVVREKAGVFDRRFAPKGFEMDDFCLSAKLKGFGVCVESGVAVTHLIDEESYATLLKEDDAVRQRQCEFWKRKWGWHPEFPDLHAIRAKWGGTPLVTGHLAAPLPEMVGTPPVDVILVTWNNFKKCRRCMESLLESDYPDIRVWVLDNGSTDETPPFLKGLEGGGGKFPVTVVSTPVNIGLPAALNWLVRVSGLAGSDGVTPASLLARLDDDVILQPDWLSKMVSALKRHSQAGLVGCKILEPDGKTIQFADHRFWPQGFGYENQPDEGQCDYLALSNSVRGCCLLYRREVFAAAGMFDIRYSPSQVDDPDHQVALRAAGYDVLFEGRVGVIHDLNAGKDFTPKAQANAVGNWIKFQGKWGGDAYEILQGAYEQSGRMIEDARHEKWHKIYPVAQFLRV